MPSASSKTENKGPLEVQDPFKAAQSVVEKKVRNLEKRKGKLEIIREKRDQGEVLNSDQQKAIDCYDAVITSLEVTRDLQKQFLEIQNELDKYAKKKARQEKKERAEKRAAEVKRVREILQIQSLLDCMGTESVRNHFKAGKNNAKVLSEDNLTQLDEFYKLISPSRDDKDFEENLSQAAEHIYSYLEGREADAAGTTYKDLKELVDGIFSCGYFDKYPYEEENDEPEEPTQTTVETEPETEVQLTEEEPPKEVVDVHQEESPVLEQPQPPQLPPQQQQPQQQQQPGPELVDQQVNNADATTRYAEDDSYFSVPSFPNGQRPFQDIVSSVQGTFNFLQESQIASESVPHMDPAVVAAQPMHKSQTDVLHGASFQGVNMLGDEQLSQLAQSTQQAQQPQQPPTPVDRLGGATDPGVTDPTHQQQQQQAPSALDSTYTPSPQDYSQNLMSQNLATSSGHTYGDQSAPLGHSHTHSGMDQSVVMATPDMPPSIPLPNQGSLPDQGISQDTQEKKPFAMNPNAAMFQSMYNTTITQPQHNQSGSQMPSQMAQSMANSMTNDKGLNQGQNEFQSNGFGNNTYGGRSSSGSGPRGGLRGGGGRGGRGGMSNGYMRNGSRGGGGGYSSGRGGSYSGSRGGSGRGGTYQGFPPRSDYRPEGGYQGYNNSFSNGSGFTKRGGASGSGGTGATPSRNNPGSVRGAGGAVRGGPPRGGSDRSGRGPPRGGYGGRPNSAQQSA